MTDSPPEPESIPRNLPRKRQGRAFQPAPASAAKPAAPFPAT